MIFTGMDGGAVDDNGCEPNIDKAVCSKFSAGVSATVALAQRELEVAHNYFTAAAGMDKEAANWVGKHKHRTSNQENDIYKGPPVVLPSNPGGQALERARGRPPRARCAAYLPPAPLPTQHTF